MGVWLGEPDVDGDAVGICVALGDAETLGVADGDVLGVNDGVTLRDGFVLGTFV